MIDPCEPTYQVKTTGEAEAQKREKEIGNYEKRVTWDNIVRKSRDKDVLRNNVPWDDADAKERSDVFLCLGAGEQRRLQNETKS